MPDPSLTPGHFEAAYAGAPPWDIGRPQPEVERLLADGEFRGDVVDLGCGTGENALLLAARGHPVVGLDAAPTAIARAQAKARERNLPATFLVHDALDAGALRHRFSSALDCGLFHVFDDADRTRYVASLAEAIGSGGVLHLLCFSDEEPAGAGPRRVAQWELRNAFRGSFVVTRIREARFATRLHGDEGARAWLATMTRI